MENRAFEELWRGLSDIGLSLSEDREDMCLYARHFDQWAAPLYEGELANPNHVGINQMMLLITKRYFEWRSVVPRAHRDRIGERSHVCIFHIFERYYQRLKALELSIAPPMLFLPPSPPPARPRPAIEGITLGEVLGELE